MKKYDILTDRATKELAPLFKKYKIPFNGFDRELHGNSSWPKTRLFCFQVLRKAGYTVTQATWMVYGIPEKFFKCEYELKGGICTRDCYAVDRVVRAYIRRVFLKDETMEVGFDISEFSATFVIKKFGLAYLGEVESAFSRERRKEDPNTRFQPMMYKVWTDDAGNWYSSGKGLGACWYQGFIFQDAKTAFKFVRFMISQPDFYIKEIKFMSSEAAGISERQQYMADMEFQNNMGADPDEGKEDAELELGAF